MNAAPPTATAMLGDLESRISRLPGGPLLADQRRAAAADFARTGIPTSRSEAWRQLNLRPLTATAFRPFVAATVGLTNRDAMVSLSAVRTAARLIFVDGYRIQDDTTRALTAGVRIQSLAAVDGRDLASAIGTVASLAPASPFVALNTAVFADGARIDIAPGTQHAAPIHLLFVSRREGSPRAFHPRVHIHAGAGSSVTVVEEYITIDESPTEADGPLTNAVTEVDLAEGASVAHVRLVRESRNSLHTGAVAVRQAAGSTYRSTSILTGGRLTRVDLYVRLGGTGAACHLDGLYRVDGVRVADHHTRIDHAVPGTMSRQLYKGIADGRGTGIFAGRIHVAPGAQKTDADQQCRSLLLSDDARADAMPQLEIYADDVKCAHGATIGSLDDDALFYLRQRGIPVERARALLTAAFLNEVPARIVHADVRRDVSAALAHDAGVEPAGEPEGA